MSQIREMQNKHRAIAQKVMILMEWTELEYGAYMMQAGMEYMRYVLYMDDWAIAFMSQSKLFWGWFRSQWYQREEHLFLPEATGMGHNDRMLKYKTIHSPIALSNHPHAHIMEETYSKMITEFNKSLVYG
ncbi:MAG: hypothetical protein R2800_10015 [Flavipsychrobacter sp.]